MCQFFWIIAMFASDMCDYQTVSQFVNILFSLGINKESVVQIGVPF